MIEIQRNALSLSLSLSLFFFVVGCEAIGGGGLPPPEEGSRVLAEESVSDVFIDFREDGYADSVRVEVPYSGDLGAAATDFLSRHAALFGLDGGSYGTTARPARTAGPMEVVDVDVTLDGVPIAAGVIVVAAMNGSIRFVSNGVPHPRAVDTTPTISEGDATAAVASLYMTAPDASAPELVIIDVMAYVGSESEEVDLAWRVEVSAPEPEIVYVSAVDGEVIFTEPTVYEGGLSRTIRDGLGVKDFVMSAAREPALANEMDGVVMSSPDTDAMWEQLATTYAYFEDNFFYESYDNMCSPLNAVVNFGGASNAYWWNGTMYFTPGNVTQDIVSHEFGHGVVRHIGAEPLVYAYRSGALSEHLADAFAALTDDTADWWVVGEGSDLGILRNLQDPTALGHPDYRSEFVRTLYGACETADDCMVTNMVRDRCRRGSCVCIKGCDSGHVHSNSSIMNHAFYLMAVGGTHASDGGREVEGIGTDKLEDVYFTAMPLLRANSGFSAWKAYVLQACMSIVESGMSFGAASSIERRDCGRILEAFDRIGYGPGDRDLDMIDDERDICPSDYNPEQDIEAECVRDPYRHCAAQRYERAYELFREGVDIGFERNHADTLLISARCAISTRDFITAQQFGVEAAGATGSGGRADGFYIAEFAAERLGRVGAAAGYGEAGLEAGAESGMCAGGTEEERMGCAGFQRSGTRSGLERLLEEE